MNESFVPRQAVIAWSLWFVVALLAAMGVVTMLLASTLAMRHTGLALLMLAGIVAPAAAVAHIRLYTVRVCNLIRNTNGMKERDDLRAVR